MYFSHFIFHSQLFQNRMPELTRKPEHSTMGPNWNGSQNGIDKYDFSHITVSNPDAFYNSLSSRELRKFSKTRLNMNLDSEFPGKVNSS